MMDITEHYAQLMGIQSPWLIEDVKLDMTDQRVDIFVDYTAKEGLCPECGCNAPRYDDREERVWRHLDTMQFTTYLHCRVPRIRCPEHGVKTLMTPWASKNSRFTLLFEAFAIKLLLAARSIEEARKLLGLNWHQLNDIKARAVERGLARREDDAVSYVGIDEKQFRSGHRYISSLVDLEEGRVLDVVEGRTEEDAKSLLNNGLSTDQRAKVEAVALDMWPAYTNAVNAVLPSAAIVHDRFHISQHLNQAVDLVRRQENRELCKKGDHRLRGTKHMWLCNEENQHERYTEVFAELKHSNLKVARSWAIREQFRPFWASPDKETAKAFFDRWYS
jgi:transposase